MEEQLLATSAAEEAGEAAKGSLSSSLSSLVSLFRDQSESLIFPNSFSSSTSPPTPTPTPTRTLSFSTLAPPHFHPLRFTRLTAKEESLLQSDGNFPTPTHLRILSLPLPTKTGELPSCASNEHIHYETYDKCTILHCFIDTYPGAAEISGNNYNPFVPPPLLKPHFVLPSQLSPNLHSFIYYFPGRVLILTNVLITILDENKIDSKETINSSSLSQSEFDESLSKLISIHREKSVRIKIQGEIDGLARVRHEIGGLFNLNITMTATIVGKNTVESNSIRSILDSDGSISPLYYARFLADHTVWQFGTILGESANDPRPQRFSDKDSFFRETLSKELKLSVYELGDTKKLNIRLSKERKNFSKEKEELYDTSYLNSIAKSDEWEKRHRQKWVDFSERNSPLVTTAIIGISEEIISPIVITGEYRLCTAISLTFIRSLPIRAQIPKITDTIQGGTPTENFPRGSSLIFTTNKMKLIEEEKLQSQLESWYNNVDLKEILTSCTNTHYKIVSLLTGSNYPNSPNRHLFPLPLPHYTVKFQSNNGPSIVISGAELFEGFASGAINLAGYQIHIIEKLKENRAKIIEVASFLPPTGGQIDVAKFNVHYNQDIMKNKSSAAILINYSPSAHSIDLARRAIKLSHLSRVSFQQSTNNDGVNNSFNIGVASFQQSARNNGVNGGVQNIDEVKIEGMAISKSSVISNPLDCIVHESPFIATVKPFTASSHSYGEPSFNNVHNDWELNLAFSFSNNEVSQTLGIFDACNGLSSKREIDEDSDNGESSCISLPYRTEELISNHLSHTPGKNPPPSSDIPARSTVIVPSMINLYDRRTQRIVDPVLFNTVEATYSMRDKNMKDVKLVNAILESKTNEEKVESENEHRDLFTLWTISTWFGTFQEDEDENPILSYFFLIPISLCDGTPSVTRWKQTGMASLDQVLEITSSSSLKQVIPTELRRCLRLSSVEIVLYIRKKTGSLYAKKAKGICGPMEADRILLYGRADWPENNNNPANLIETSSHNTIGRPTALNSSANPSSSPEIIPPNPFSPFCPPYYKFSALPLVDFLRISSGCCTNERVFPHLKEAINGIALAPIYAYSYIKTQNDTVLSQKQIQLLMSIHEGGFFQIGTDEKMTSMNAFLAFQPHLRPCLIIPVTNDLLLPSSGNKSLANPFSDRVSTESNQKVESIVDRKEQKNEEGNELIKKRKLHTSTPSKSSIEFILNLPGISHHCLSLLDVNSIVHGLRVAAASIRTFDSSKILSNASYWEKSLVTRFGQYSDFGQWSEKVLITWMKIMIKRQGCTGNKNEKEIKNSSVSSTTRILVSSDEKDHSMSIDEPNLSTEEKMKFAKLEEYLTRKNNVYFYAAIHLQARLNRFHIEVMKQAKNLVLPQLYSSSELESLGNEPDIHLQHFNGCSPVPFHPIPYAMVFLLLLAPPFCPLSSSLGDHRIWYNSTFMKFESMENLVANRIYPTSASPDLNRSSSDLPELRLNETNEFIIVTECPSIGTIFPLFTGPTYVEEEESNKHKGIPVRYDYRQPRLKQTVTIQLRLLYLPDINAVPIINRSVYKSEQIQIQALSLLDFILKEEKLLNGIDKERQKWRDAAKRIEEGFEIGENNNEMKLEKDPPERKTNSDRVAEKVMAQERHKRLQEEYMKLFPPLPSIKIHVPLQERLIAQLQPYLWGSWK